MILLIALLLTSCSEGSSEITLSRAELSSNYFTDQNLASRCIDGNPATLCWSGYETNPWLRLVFSSSADVGKVVLVQGWNPGSHDCVYQLSVYRGPWKTPCGSFTTVNGAFLNIAIQCGGHQGDSVLFEQSGCNGYIRLDEIKVYSFINAQTAIASASQNGLYFHDRGFAAQGFDNNYETSAITGDRGAAWLRGYFASSTEVDKVLIVGYNEDAACVYQVSVLTGEEKTPCSGTFTIAHRGGFTETVECGGTRGESIMLEQSVCGRYISVNIRIYDYIHDFISTGKTNIKTILYVVCTYVIFNLGFKCLCPVCPLLNLIVMI